MGAAPYRICAQLSPSDGWAGGLGLRRRHTFLAPPTFRPVPAPFDLPLVHVRSPCESDMKRWPGNVTQLSWRRQSVSGSPGSRRI